MDLPMMPGLIIQVLLYLSITCIQTYFYFKTIGLSPKWVGLRLVLIMLFVTFIATALQYVTSNFATLSLLGILIPVTYILYPMLFMGGKFKERILFGIVNCAIFLLSILLGTIAMYPKYRESLAMLLLFFGIVISIYTILVLLMSRLNTEGKRYMPRKYWTGMVICFSIISIGLVIVNRFNIWIKESEGRHMYLTIFSLGFLIIWVLMYFVLYYVCRYFSKTAEANMIAYQKDMIEKFILQKQASDQRIKILSHDLKHSLMQWRTMAEEKRDEAALKSITEYEEQLSLSLLINVENESANAIINQKSLEAQQVQVSFLVDGVFYNDLLISKLDVCSLLGNLLDNAIEAAAKAETEALRCVKLSIKRKNNILILVVENGYAIEPVIENGVFVTYKKDTEHHAIGMLSIQYVAEKYNGTVNYTFKNNRFKSTVMLSGYSDAL